MANESNSAPPASAENNNAEPLAIEPPPPADAPTKLDLSSGSDSIALDHLGPLVVNSDGV
jgi:hypothetical protein